MKKIPLISTSYIATDIKDGDILPIEGWVDAAGHVKVTQAVKVDAANFESFFAACDSFRVKNAETLSQHANWFNEHGDVPHDLGLHLYVLNRAFEKFYPHDPSKDKFIREAFYKDNNNDHSLSNALNLGIGACSERSALTQLYLQRYGFDSSYINGEILWQRSDEFGDAHAYIAIKHSSGSAFVFDPNIPIQADKETTLPRIASANDISWEQLIEEGRNNPRYVEVTEVLSKSRYYYGVSANTNVRNDYFIEPPIASSITAHMHLKK